MNLPPGYHKHYEATIRHSPSPYPVRVTNQSHLVEYSAMRDVKEMWQQHDHWKVNSVKMLFFLLKKH